MNKTFENKKMLCCLLIMLCLAFMKCDSLVMADGGGSYISSDVTSGIGSGSGGGGGIPGFPSTASWFYYSYLGDNEGEDVKFLPIAFNVGDLNSAVTINGACAKKDGGFWHFGRTETGGSLGCEFRYGGPCDDTPWGNYYIMDPYGYHHSQTINYWNWNSAWEYSSPEIYNNGHEIYNGWQLKYKATKSSSNPWGDNWENSDVTKAWKQACSVSGRTDCDWVPGDVSYFCWWPGMEKVDISGRATVGQISDSYLNNTEPKNEPSTIDYKSTGYVQTNKTITYEISNCPETGCLAKLGLYLKWNTGSAKVGYNVTIERDGKSSSWNLEAAKPNDSSELKVAGRQQDRFEIGNKNYIWGIEKLTPGKEVCYQLQFKKDGSTGNDITVKSCAKAKAKPKVTLNAYAVDTNGNFLIDGQIAGAPVTVDSGGKVSLNRPDIKSYGFMKWVAASSNSKNGCKGGNTLKQIGTSATYTVNGLTADGTVCAVYGQNVLTAKAIDTNGKSLSSVFADVSTQGAYGSTTKVTRRAATTGYVFRGWKAKSSDSNYFTDTDTDGKYYISGSSSPKESFNVKSLKTDTVVYAVYERDSFQARARVFEGDGTSGKNSKSTGFVASDASETLDVNCQSSGCKVSFDLALKTVAGSGKTTYTVYRSTGGSGSPKTVSPASSLAPSTSGTILKINKKDYAVETLKPDETVCYYVIFTPFGTLSNTTTKTVKACAHAKPSTFQGKTVVSGGASKTAGYTTDNKSKTARVTVSNCSNGCKVTFNHYLKRTSGIGTTNYTVERFSNLVNTKSGRSISAGKLKDSTPFGNDKETVVSTSKDLVMYPGMVVCETLTFKPNDKSDTGDIYTRVCVSALGDAQPGDVSLIKMEVKNTKVATYNKFLQNVYAKPGDLVTYRATYSPRLQYTYYLVPEKMQIDGGTIYPTDNTINNTCPLGFSPGCTSLFDSYRNSGSNKGRGLEKWNNDFSVQQSSDNFKTSSLKGNYNQANGSIDSVTKDNDYTITTSDVGKKVEQKAITNINKATKTTPSQVSFSEDNNRNIGNVITNPIDSAASAMVPYNFTNGTTISNNNNNNVAYAGDSFTVKFDYIIGPKDNSLTSGKYATSVPGAKYNIRYKVGNDAWKYVYPEGVGKELGISTDVASDKMAGGRTISATSGKGFLVPDYPAGTTIIIQSMIWPQTSGADDNMSVDGFSGWATSKEMKVYIAKKPSLQVWGGNVYSAGKIDLGSNVAKKNFNDSIRYFGSWGALGVVNSAGVSGFGSGSSMGYNNMNNDGNLSPSPYQNNNSITGASKFGGSTSDKECVRSLLTLPNQSICSSGSSSSSNNLLSMIQNNSNYIANTFGLKTSRESSGDSVTIRGGEKNSTNYYYNASGITVTGANSLQDAAKYIVYSAHDKGVTTISGNLEVNGKYSSFTTKPLIIIYGNKVNITCNVTRIDALIIAEETVDTCSDGTNDVNNVKRSNQLTVNGAIIAKKLLANRTYGAATGANSIIPAEIIKFDPSLYLFGGEVNDSGENTNLELVNIKEMAPRL